MKRIIEKEIIEKEIIEKNEVTFLILEAPNKKRRKKLKGEYKRRQKSSKLKIALIKYTKYR